MSEVNLVAGDMRGAAHAVRDAAGGIAPASAEIGEAADAMPGSTSAQLMPGMAREWDETNRAWRDDATSFADGLEQYADDMTWLDTLVSFGFGGSSEDGR